MGIEVQLEPLDETKANEVINPNFIYNRPDLFDKKNALFFKILNQRFTKYVMGWKKGKRFEVGSWLMKFHEDEMHAIARFVFAYDNEIRKVVFPNCYSCTGTVTRGNFFRIVLPKSHEEFEKRISKKGRYNLRRATRLLENEGASFCEYTSSDVPESIIKAHIKLKMLKYNVPHLHEYHSLKEYILASGVTHIYTIECEARVIATLFSCEQTPFVYLENLSYDLDYAKYSPGMILYNYYLHRLIDKKMDEVFLEGGEYDYKRRFGSVESVVYQSVIYRLAIRNLYGSMKTVLKRYFH